jgi:hypothetical protein
MTTLSIGNKIGVAVSGTDANGNSAPVTLTGVAIDNHAIAFAVVNDPQTAVVVSLGPAGNFNLTLAGQSALGAPLTATVPFTVPAGDATTLVATPGAQVQWVNWQGPPVPAGW